MKMCDNNGDPFIARLHNILLAQGFCNRLFSIIMLISLGHTCLFNKRFFTMYFGYKEEYAFTLPHSAQRKHVFLVKIKKMSNTKKVPSIKKSAL